MKNRSAVSTPVFPEGRMNTVLCIDDDELILEISKLLLQEQGHSVLTASSGRSGLALLSIHAVDVVLLDYQMPEMNGHQVAVEIKGQKPYLPIIMFSGTEDLPDKTLQLMDAVVSKGQPDALAAITQLVASLPATVSPEPTLHTEGLSQQRSS
jgi:CheY-like chemotaxis protein